MGLSFLYTKPRKVNQNTYTYDPLHRRLTKTVGGVTTRFLYDGLNEIGAAVALELAGKYYAPIHDLQGNVAALYDPIEKILIDENRYTAFGVETAPSKINPWRYLSKHADAESGLIYFGRRYYDPSEGRWISCDPLGFTDSLNLYAFALNDPFLLVDPYGLFSVPSFSMPVSYIPPQVAMGHINGMIDLYNLNNGFKILT